MIILKILGIIFGLIVSGFLGITAFAAVLGKGMSPGSDYPFWKCWRDAMGQFLGL